jgi:hypothetical protein
MAARTDRSFDRAVDIARRRGAKLLHAVEFDPSVLIATETDPAGWDFSIEI